MASDSQKEHNSNESIMPVKSNKKKNKKSHSLSHQKQGVTGRSHRTTWKHAERLLQAGWPKKIQQDANGHNHLVFRRVRFYSYSIRPRNSSTHRMHSPVHVNDERETNRCESIPNLFGKKQISSTHTTHTAVWVQNVLSCCRNGALKIK